MINNEIHGLNVTLFQDDNTLLNQLLTLVLLHHKNVYVPCSIKSFAKDMYALLTHYGVRTLIHTGDDSQQQKESIRNVNEVWSTYQVVIGTNVLAGGVDFNQRHFHSIMAFLDNRGAPFRLMKQVIGRVRKVLDGDLLIHVTQHAYSLPLSPEMIKRTILNKIWSCADSLTQTGQYKNVDDTIVPADFEVSEARPITTLDKDRCIKTTYEDTWFTQNHCLTKHEVNHSRNDYMSLVLKWCQHEQFPVTVVQYAYFPLWLLEMLKWCHRVMPK